MTNQYNYEAQTALDPADLDALSRASTATITTQLFNLGYRNTFLAGVRLQTTTAGRMVGEAFTLRYIPAREDIDVLSAFDNYDHPQRKAIESTRSGQILVMDCRQETRAASAGNILLTRLAARGAAGVVTDGSLRDIAGISEIDMPVYAAAPSAMTNLALHHAVDLNVPIGCAGVAVFPGDVLVGDSDGVVCVPRHLVGDIAQAAAQQEALEDFILARVQRGAKLRGTYPPDEQTLEEYARHRGGVSSREGGL